MIILVCAAIAFLGVFISSIMFDVDYIEPQEQMSVKGRVTALPYKSDYGDTIIVLDKASINDESCGRIKIYVESGAEGLEPGDTIEAVADIEIPSGVRNPGGYNEKLQYLSQGIYYKAYTDDIYTAGYNGGVMIVSAKIREYIGGVMDDIFEDDVQGVAKAMLLGEKYDLDEEVYSSFRDTGMAHVLAVSGLHAGILIGFFYMVLRCSRLVERLNWGSRLALWFCMHALPADAFDSASFYNGGCASYRQPFR